MVRGRERIKSTPASNNRKMAWGRREAGRLARWYQKNRKTVSAKWVKRWEGVGAVMLKRKFGKNSASVPEIVKTMRGYLRNKRTDGETIDNANAVQAMMQKNVLAAPERTS